MSSQPNPIHRSVGANTLVSNAQPAITIHVQEPFQFAGDLEFILAEVAQVHIFAFVVTTGKRIERLLRVQFEGYLPNNVYTYDYTVPDRIRLGAHEYLYNPAVYNLHEVVQQRPQSDTGQFAAFLRAQGYELPEHVMMERFIRLLDDAKRNEILLIYLEDLSPTGFISDDFKEGGRGLAAWEQLGPGLLERGLASFTVVD